jgi:hypothetical protein
LQKKQSSRSSVKKTSAWRNAAFFKTVI